MPADHIPTAHQHAVAHTASPTVCLCVLQDELSAWETAAAPLWGTFTGHCEGEWLGQYGAYTPWGGEGVLGLCVCVHQ